MGIKTHLLSAFELFDIHSLDNLEIEGYGSPEPWILELYLESLASIQLRLDQEIEVELTGNADVLDVKGISHVLNFKNVDLQLFERG